MTIEDISGYKAVFCEPIISYYDNYTLYGINMPSPGPNDDGIVKMDKMMV